MGCEFILVCGVIHRNAVDCLLAQWYCCPAASCFACLLLPMSMDRQAVARHILKIRPVPLQQVSKAGFGGKRGRGVGTGQGREGAGAGNTR